MSEQRGTFDRFRALEDETGAPLDAANTPLAGDDDATFGLSFVRCAVCGVDAHRSSRECAHCGADLTTPEQRAFLQSFAQERLAQAAQQKEEAAGLAEAQKAAVADASALRLNEAMQAQQAAEDEAAPAVRFTLGPGASYILRAGGGVLLFLSLMQLLWGRAWLSIPLFLAALGCAITVMWMHSQGRS